MALYRVTINICSPIATSLKGDTIWGHIIWGIANHEGDLAVQDFLKKENQTPQLVVSDAFPSGYICKPLPKPNNRLSNFSADDYAKFKQQKKIKFIPASHYLSTPSPDNLSYEGTGFMHFEASHNRIDRISGTVLDDALFTTDELWPLGVNKKIGDALFDIYVESTLSSTRIKELFIWAFENGYGADSSTGKGKIEIVAQPSQVNTKYKSASYMALGPFVCDNEKILSSLRADTFTRSGKIGGSFISDNMCPFKKTVILFDAGAVFESTEKLSFIGQIISNIHSDNRICQSGFTPVIPIIEE